MGGVVPNTRLARALALRNRYTSYVTRRQPSGANSEQFEAWREWVAARRAVIAAEIKSAQAEKRTNQRSKADERKRNPNGAT